MEEIVANESKVNPLGVEPVGKLVAQYALPSVISMVVNSLYNMVDQVFIGQGVGYLGNAATNIIMPLTMIVMALSMMFGNGAASYMSLQLGRGNKKMAARGVGNMITLTVGGGILLAVVFEVAITPLCRFFGGQGEVLSYALDYGRIVVFGTPVFTMGVSFGNVIRADGRPKESMAGMLVGCITNMILDPVFIFAFGWGVKGAAWATVIGQLLVAVYYVWCMVRFKTIKLGRGDFKLSWPVVWRISSIGFSSMITQAATVFVIAIQNNLLVSCGAASIYGADIPRAAFGITMKTSQLIMSIAMGIATGIQPVIGFNYGSLQFDRVKRTFKVALAACTVIMLIALFMFQVFPRTLISIFGKENELYMEFAVKCFRIYLLAVLFIPPGLVVGMFFQSVGQALPAAILSLFRQVVILIPAMFAFAHFLGVEGLLWAGAFSDFTSGLIAIFMAAFSWKSIFAMPQNDLKGHTT